MKTNIAVLLVFLFTYSASAQDTFSICAIDSLTGQVGSAGATCIPSATTSAIIISDIEAGVGVVHTQAWYLASNQNYASNLLFLGLPPQQIIDSVLLHDVQNDSTKRQYGVVTIDGSSAAFTGSNTDDYKSHITGPGYAIQGNILLGQVVLDSMESKFLNTPGNLECRLMAALQGAKMVGADTRCTPYGISSFSAFIRVANPGEIPGSFYLDISVNTYPNHGDPIDSLHERFDLWGGCGTSGAGAFDYSSTVKISPNPVEDYLLIESLDMPCWVNLEIISASGEKLLSRKWENNPDAMRIDCGSFKPGLFFVKILSATGQIFVTKLMKH